MPNVISNLLHSEKGIMALLIIASTTLLTALGRIEPTTQQWLEFSTLWLGIYTAGKTFQGAASSFASRPAAAGTTVTNVATPPPAVEARKEGGFIDLSLLRALSILSLGVIVCAFGLMSLTGCTWIKKEGQAVASSLVDCTKGTVGKVVNELGPLFDVMLSQSVDDNGRVQWGQVADLTKGFTTSVGGCVLADAVARALATPNDPGAPMTASLVFERVSLLDGFRTLSSERFGGATFKTSHGDL